GVRLTSGKTYEVHAVTIFEGVDLMLIVEDDEMPSWRPGWLFDVVDTSLPTDWICQVFHSQVSVVMGPAFIAESEAAYAAMVNQDDDQLERFWRRADARQNT
ncbi:MAG TPA: hypothetical protein VH044_16945, partial [Polyangiaceae bacterium]|nr:hypothetical protein [Polyangiaceae bacterium]